MLSFLFFTSLLPALVQAEIRFEFRTESIKGEDGVERKVEVLLPTDTTNPDRKFPVVYYFSGYKMEDAKGNIPSEIREVHFDKLQSTLVKLGVIEPTIFVNPLINGVIADTPGGTKESSFIFNSVMPREKEWNADGRRSLSGNSLGGLNATSLVMARPDLFDSVALRQPLIFSDNAPWLKSDEALRQDFLRRTGAELEPWVYDIMAKIRRKLPDAETNRAVLPIDQTSERAQMPKLFLDFGAQDTYLDLEKLKAVAREWPGETEVRERPGLGHGGDLAVGGLIDSFMITKFQKGTKPTPAGELLLRLRKENLLTPIIKDFFVGDVMDGIAKFAQAVSRDRTVISGEDLALLRDLVNSLAPHHATRNFLNALESLSVGPGPAPGTMELKLSIKPKNCAKENLLFRACQQDRLYLPVDSDGLWDRLSHLAQQRREFVREIRSAGCHHTMASFAPALVKLTEELNELLARVDSGKEKTLELQPEVSFVVRPAGKALAIEKMNGISLLAGLPFGLQPNVVGVKLSPEGKTKVKLHKFGLEMEREL